MHTTSATLLERVRLRTDRAAWDRFVRLYTPLLYCCGKRFGLAEADAADAVQDVFVLLLVKLPTFQYAKDGSFRTWLRTVTVNKFRERFRKRHETVAGGSERGLSDVADKGDSDEFWNVEHRRQLVSRALQIMQSEFEETTWQACWQTTVHDRSAAEVAAELKITINAVYVARSRVLRRLREELRDLLDE